ncbi:MAG: hypothetical protein RL701_7841 [Pseudomonadota bacterium]|jgi:hypothetical protein
MTRAPSAAEIAARVSLLVERAGLRNLTQLSGVEDIAGSLQTLQRLCMEDDPLTREFARSEAVIALKAARIPGGSRLVDQVIPKKTDSASRRETGQTFVHEAATAVRTAASRGCVRRAQKRRWPTRSSK